MNCRACNEVTDRPKWAWYCFLCLKLKHPLQAEAGSLVFNATLYGGLPKARGQACVDCGGPAILYDHRDYLKPLEVEPVCDGCNKRRGPALTFLNNVQHFRLDAQ